ncbi:MAG: leucine-rich repeat domain-containing protein [Bacteroides sp.]|nr:leucine-rich repeat domain-containing protein [Bacteroides sp.]MBD5422875.1 leucine-rich repeat domain-containing protein [Bacteroides sp.]
MKKTLLLLFLSLLIATSTTARDFTFTYEGQTLTYTVIDENKRTCETKGSSTYSDCHSISGSLTIPSSADGYTVTAIGQSSFQYCKDLTELTIPTSVSSINDYAFRCCTGLTSVTLPVSSIGEMAFAGCSGLTSVTFTESLKYINAHAFVACSGLTTVYIPKSCTLVSQCAFGNCERLLSIEVDPENKSYASSDGVLFKKDFTTLVQCPAGKEGDYIIPESVSTIYYNAFTNSALTSISIPETVTTIEDYAFRDCQNLISISIPESVNYIDEYTFYNCTGLTSIDLPKGLEEIGNHAFENCSGLTSVSIPETVTTIANFAFQNCSGLTSISIPESMRSIHTATFNGCTNLTEIQCFMQEPCKAYGSSFDSKTYEKATLYVPTGTVSLYQATTPWNKFKNITDEPLLSGIEDVVADGVDAIDFAMPYEVYNLQGALVGHSTDGLAAGVYIVRQGEKSAKVAIR